MLYMVIERFSEGADIVYARFREKGRMLPDGLGYIDSWVSEDLSTCYQIMSTEDSSLLDQWMSYWNDIVSFDVVPILQSSDAQRQVFGVEQVSTPPRT